jgi:glutamine amidotransferase
VKIAVIDYGMGNLRSVLNGLRAVGASPLIARAPEEVIGADALVLPGVGAFGDCMRNLRSAGLDGAVLSSLKEGKPYLGICLGLQILFEESEEFGKTPGLGYLNGKVVPFEKGLRDGRGARLKVPHMGWNEIRKERATPALEGIPDGAHFYFVHSFHVVPEETDLIATTTDYGIRFVSSIAKGNVFACQFHPERSGPLGLKVLRKFIEWARGI